MATEKRLISIDEALEATHREPFWTKSEAAYIRSFLVKLPKADAVEVVHGRWKAIEASDELYQCSACGEWQFIPEEHFAYCPNCGAKMDGDGNATD